VNPWALLYDAYDPDNEGLQEALCTLGNGYLATRGAAAEAQADDIHYPGTYVAGLYNRLGTEVADRTVENEDLVNLPNWLPLTFRVADGPWFSIDDVEVLSFRRELDLRRGELTRQVEVRDGEGRETLVTERRFVSMHDRHLAAQRVGILPRNWSGTFTVRAGVDAGVVNAGVPRYRELRGDHHQRVASGEDGEVVFAQVETKQSHVRVALAARITVSGNGDIALTSRRFVDDGGLVAQDFVLTATPGRSVTVEKVVALHTSRDTAISESLLDARARVVRAAGYEPLLEQHVMAWGQLWRRFDIAIDDSDRTQMIIRLHLFHLLQTASPHTMDLDVGVPARGWHGEAYRGHIFWDELFIFPLLNLRLPVLTRSLLLYRFRRLDQARWAARADGHRGAMYPWQSGSNGREETQQLHLNPKSGRWLPDHSHLQRHVNIAIAYNVWQYFQVTGDMAFLRHYAAPMLLEIARFLADLATFNTALNRYEMRGVMGPDEYHESYPDRDEPGLDNNTYTNVMTVWVLMRAFEVLEHVAEYQRAEICQMMALGDEELDRWGDITRKMVVAFHDDGTGRQVMSQFQGYERLEEFDWQGYRARYGDIARLDRILEAEGDSTNRYRLSKQPDTLMLFFLLSGREIGELFDRLGYEFNENDIHRTIDYYSARTSHGSTLSKVVHSWVLAREDRARSWEFFCQALEADISDVQGGTTPEGIHLGAMVGSVDLLLRGYGGIETRGDVLRFKPQVPEELGAVSFDLSYRSQQLHVRIEPNRLVIVSEPAPVAPVRIAVAGHERSLAPGERIEVALRS